MMERFAGWSAGAMDLLVRLEGEPPQSLLASVAAEHERLIRQPMVALLEELAAADEAYEDFSVWGRGRATLWGWQRQSAVIRVARSVDYALSFDLDGLAIQGAWWYPKPGQVERFRAVVAGNGEALGASLASIVAGLRASGFDVTGDVMSRLPRGIPVDHPRADLLKHRTMVARRRFEPEAVTAAPEVLEQLSELRPFMRWFAAHVA